MGSADYRKLMDEEWKTPRLRASWGSGELWMTLESAAFNKLPRPLAYDEDLQLVLVGLIANTRRSFPARVVWTELKQG